MDQAVNSEQCLIMEDLVNMEDWVVTGDLVNTEKVMEEAVLPEQMMIELGGATQYNESGG